MGSALRVVGLGVALSSLLVSSGADDDRHPRGKAPLEVLVDHLRGPAGLAVAPDGTLFFTDAKAGSLSRRRPDGTLTLLRDRLKSPRGLARSADGTLLVLADELRPQGGRPQKGVLFQWSSNGVATVLASGFRKPQQLVLGPNQIAVSTEKGISGSDDGDHDDDDHDGDDDDEAGVVFRLSPSGAILGAHEGFEEPSGLLMDADGTLIVAAEKAPALQPTRRGNLFRVSVSGDVSLLMKDRYDDPAGLVRDALGFLFLAVEKEREDGDDGGLILKMWPDGQVRRFASAFESPWGLALDAGGHLYVSDEKGHRIYRFRAPAMPVVPAVVYTNQASVTLRGTAEPRSWITVRGGAADVGVATDAAGSFSVSIALPSNQTTTLLVYATGAAGEGLTSAPAIVKAVQDSIPPTIVAHASPLPNGNGWNRTNVTVSFSCADAESGVASCSPPVQLTSEGAGQVVQGTARDNAGNSTTTSVQVNIDKTPPVVTTSVFPTPNASGWYHTDPTVSFECTDQLSQVATCPGPAGALSDGQAVTVSGTAEDLAGNQGTGSVVLKVDRTPPTIQIQSPAAGSLVNTTSVHASGAVSDGLSGVAAAACNGRPATLSPSAFACDVALSEGPNTITVEATDVAGGTSTARVSLFMTPVTTAHARVENPQSGMTLFAPFQVWGWAIDPRAATGTGIDRVDVWAVRQPPAAAAVAAGVAPAAAGPIFLGTATYGLDRPDIRSILGDRFASSGYAFAVRNLAPGKYTLQISARSTVTGTFDDVQSASVTVVGTGGGGGGGGGSDDFGVRYRAHVENIGWMDWVEDDAVAGTEGQSLRMEAVQIETRGAPGGVHICYEAHVQNIGWMNEVCDGGTGGTEGQSLRMEALKVRLRNAPAGTKVCYRAHVENIGWMDEVCDGEVAGTEGQSLRMEAVRIRIKNPPHNLPPPSGFGTRYRAHVESIGWMDWVHDGAVAGTEGQSLRMEAVQIETHGTPSGVHICYQAHVESQGWMDEVCDGATAGTEGQFLRMEALKVRLVNAPLGTRVCYQAQVESQGWMDEVCDGEVAGTEGQGLRMEAVKIRISNPFHALFDDGCITWIPGFNLQHPICPPYKGVWLEQFLRWFTSGFRSYFIGLPVSEEEEVYNPDVEEFVPAQLYERGILHVWPPDPSGVASMRLGDMDRDLNGVPFSLNAPMPDDFARVWSSQGGLGVFGAPISTADFRDVGGQSVFSQYFERARMERRRPPEDEGVDFGLLTMELNNAGRIQRQRERGCEEIVEESTLQAAGFIYRTQAGATVPLRAFALTLCPGEGTTFYEPRFTGISDVCVRIGGIVDNSSGKHYSHFPPNTRYPGGYRGSTFSCGFCEENERGKATRGTRWAYSYTYPGSPPVCVR